MAPPARTWNTSELARMKNAVESGMYSLRTIAERFKCSRHAIERFIRSYGWKCPYAERSKPKGNGFRLYPKHKIPEQIASELDRAKTILRQRGHVVFNAEITDGLPGRGLVKLDYRENKTPAEIIAMAEGRP